MNFNHYSSKTIIEGKTEYSSWELILNDQKKNFDDALCTEAYCVVIHQHKILLTHHLLQGYEFVGGYIDPLHDTANLTRTMRRKVLEQTSAIVHSLQLCGYKHLIIQSTENETLEAYIPYFYAYVQEFDPRPLSREEDATYLANYTEARTLLASDHAHDLILQYIWEKKVPRTRRR
jgi:hypothetical protein